MKFVSIVAALVVLCLPALISAGNGKHDAAGLLVRAVQKANPPEAKPNYENDALAALALAKITSLETKIDGLADKVDKLTACNCSQQGQIVPLAVPKQYRAVCGPNGCTLQEVTGEQAAVTAESGGEGLSGGRQPVRGLLKRIFPRLGSRRGGGCSSCGG
jgi:hypothetical protein